MALGKRGMSILELVIGMIITLIVVMAGIQLLKFIGDRGAKTDTEVTDDTHSEIIAQTIRTSFSGLRGFQNLSFSPDGTNQSAGTGFFVQPNVDVNGNYSSGNDRVFYVVDVPMSTQVRLSSVFAIGANSLSLKSVDGTTHIDSLFTTGDLVVLSNVQNSEILKITSAASPAAAAVASFTINASSYANSFVGANPPALSNAYLQDDFVNKAKIMTIGLDPANQNLVLLGEGSSPHIIAQKVTAFSAQYSSKADFICGTTAIPAGFSRDNWNHLNSDSKNTCYHFIAQLKFSFTQNGKDGSYVFNTNQ